MSSVTPAIVLKDGTPFMAIGGYGGPQIPTAVAQVMFHYFYRETTLLEAIDHKRIHHQYVPNCVFYEEGFDSVTPPPFDPFPRFLEIFSKRRIGVFRKSLEISKNSAMKRG